MKRRDFIAGGALSLAACSSGPDLREPNLGRWKEPISELETQLPKMMQADSVPGLCAVVIEEGRVLWSRAFGVRDAEKKTPVDADTMFEAASMSKPVFAYAVMKLVERGVLNLDTPLMKYTTDRWVKDDPRLDMITPRHVLSHTTGFQNWREEDGLPLSIHFTPGTQWRYSGEGYSYLQSIVTKLTGMPIERYMQENIFDPFGMTSSGYVWSELMDRRMARPHDAMGAAQDNKKSTTESVARYASAGDLKCTPGDYAKFMLEVMAPKPQDKFRLSPESVSEMLRPHVSIGDAYGRSWALGWTISPGSTGPITNHGGDNDGFHCWALMSVARKAGLVVMTNGDGGAPMLGKLITGGSLTAIL